MLVLKAIEFMGDAGKGWEASTEKAVTEAIKTVKKIKSVRIKDQSATVKNGLIKRYRLT